MMMYYYIHYYARVALVTACMYCNDVVGPPVVLTGISMRVVQFIEPWDSQTSYGNEITACC